MQPASPSQAPVLQLTMAPPLSREMKRAIINWRFLDNKSVEEIISLTSRSSSTIYAVLKEFRETGDVGPYPNNIERRGHQRAFDMDDMNFISAVTENSPALFLDEIQERLWEVRGIHVSVATISRAVRSLAITRKQISKEAIERNELLRATWKGKFGDIPAENIVWIDESSLDDRTNQRK